MSASVVSWYDCCAPLSHPSSCTCLWIVDPHSRAAKNTSHGNEVLLQDTPHLTQRSRYQRGSLREDPAGNRATRRPADHRKATQTEVVWTCLPFNRSSQNHLARHSERGKKTRGQRKMWEDNIREWRGLEFTKSQRAVKNTEKWRKLIVKSSVVPTRPPPWRDRWRVVTKDERTERHDCGYKT